MSDVAKFLSGCFMFKNTNFNEINNDFDVLAHIRTTEYSPGELILSSEIHADAISLILSGKVRITSDSGERETVIRYAVPGEFFGVANLFSSTSHNTKVYAETNATVAFLERDLVCKLIENSPQIAMNYISFLSDKISFLNRKVAAFTAASAEIKLAMYLSGNVDENGHVTLSTSMSSLSDQLGIGRASLYRAVDSLSTSGVIKYNGKSFSVLDMDALHQIIK